MDWRWLVPNLDEFNKKLKEKLEADFGKKFVSDKVIIMGLDDEEEEDNRQKLEGGFDE
tara:strand:+ start:36 stop:209 length:174 start_codon:yes stop_codon:yes gene_type:complete